MEETVLCASSAYEQKYYLNEAFAGLPDKVKDELKIICVLFTEDVGGILTILFDEEGLICLRPEKNEEDILYDEIGCGLKIRQLELERAELWEQMETYYRTFFMQQM
jgi:hypothetical protein